jgi:hypothetical protein
MRRLVTTLLLMLALVPVALATNPPNGPPPFPNPGGPSGPPPSPTPLSIEAVPAQVAGLESFPGH